MRKLTQAAGMLALSSRSSRRVNGPARAAVVMVLAYFTAGSACGRQQTPPGQANASGGQATVQKSSEAGTAQRIPRQQALTTAAVDGVLREIISPMETRPVAAAQLTLRSLQTGRIVHANSSAEGVFRLLLLAPGHYEFRVESAG
ncbi:MAG: carboxypeptidase-like regulatory domain-containing protein, partial [Candidatus Acidiferrum sp.]